MKPYGVMFRIPIGLWMTTVDGDDVSERATRRARLRRYGRRVWRLMLSRGIQPVDRFMLWVTVAGRDDSPILAAETLKPLIDAGTDMGVWPDDDPSHRVCTCYMRDEYTVTCGDTMIGMWVIPLTPSDDPRQLILNRVPGARGVLLHFEINDDDWLTSNMRLPVVQRKARQTRLMRLAAPQWENMRLGGQVVALVGVRYPNPHYLGDPDNTAETVTALWGAGVSLGVVPKTPSLLGFVVEDSYSSPPCTHHVDMLLIRLSGPVDWVDTRCLTVSE